MGGVVPFAGSPNILTPFDPLCLHLLPALSLPSLMLPAFPAFRLPSLPSGCLPESCLPESSSLPPSWQIFKQSGQNRAKQGKNKFLFGGRWCFLGKIGDKKGRNLNIFLKSGCKVGAGCGSACLLFGVSTGPEVGRASRLQDLPEVALVLWLCVPCLCPLCCFVCGVLHLNMALFRILMGFLEGFMCFLWVFIACVLCAASGAFVCVSG